MTWTTPLLAALAATLLCGCNCNNSRLTSDMPDAKIDQVLAKRVDATADWRSVVEQTAELVDWKRLLATVWHDPDRELIYLPTQYDGCKFLAGRNADEYLIITRESGTATLSSRMSHNEYFNRIQSMRAQPAPTDWFDEAHATLEDPWNTSPTTTWVLIYARFQNGRATIDLKTDGVPIRHLGVSVSDHSGTVRGPLRVRIEGDDRSIPFVHRVRANPSPEALLPQEIYSPETGEFSNTRIPARAPFEHDLYLILPPYDTATVVIEATDSDS